MVETELHGLSALRSIDLCLPGRQGHRLGSSEWVTEGMYAGESASEESQQSVKTLGKTKIILLLAAIVVLGGLTAAYLSLPSSPSVPGPTNTNGSTGPSGPTTGPSGDNAHHYYITLQAGIGSNETV